MTSLDQFLRTAKSATYAGGGIKNAALTYNKSDDFFFEDGPYTYHDRYWGGSSFLGSEIVWENGISIWGMNYYGGPTVTDTDTATAYDFLKHALRAGTLDPMTLPVRGPAQFKHPDYPWYVYTNTLSGTLACFTGIEEISLNSRIICRHVYHGGVIR